MAPSLTSHQHNRYEVPMELRKRYPAGMIEEIVELIHEEADRVYDRDRFLHTVVWAFARSARLNKLQRDELYQLVWNKISIYKK